MVLPTNPINVQLYLETIIFANGVVDLAFEIVPSSLLGTFDRVEQVFRLAVIDVSDNVAELLGYVLYVVRELDTNWPIYWTGLRCERRILFVSHHEQYVRS